ncbi:DEAD/DEAH box helicase [Oceaniserpentilla sp. 4NH20-0058]|uniref:DEAD/DEAH box helicase n=1 Tax=Oceaniserpentilla sp. 4NH20-0058 TaxID=3127660 RepID=UPI003101D5AB
MARFQLRDYQQEAVAATLKHFRQSNESAVIVLPTGSGKSLVIAELARLARRKILVLTHVKELVEQNHQKYQSLGLEAGVYSAGLKLKQTEHQVTFASIQSAARNLDDFNQAYSLIIIDECHRVNVADKSVNNDKSLSAQGSQEVGESANQYQQIIHRLKTVNPDVKLLGLTATPYRLGLGWIYRKHYRGFVRSEQARPFEHCIYELPLRYLIKRQYLTEPKLVDATIEHYDFSSLKENTAGEYNSTEVNALLNKHHRVTKGITEQVVELGVNRQGIMIFAATVEHAKEIYRYLPAEHSALIIGATESAERDRLISGFKQRHIKYLVNVSVLTTGFDAPHVDMIAILRPTQSVSLYQQIIGRGLRLSDHKKDCLVIDYTGNDFDLFQPEVGEKKPNNQSQPVQVMCPSCEFPNVFWGVCDDDGYLVEHYGRRCQGLVDDNGHTHQCDYRFVFKECSHCGSENDIAARTCIQCSEVLVDPDDMLKKALQLKDSKVIRCAGVSLAQAKEKGKLAITYHDEQGVQLSESFDFTKPSQVNAFNAIFAHRISANIAARLGTTKSYEVSNLEQALKLAEVLPCPDFVIAKKQKYYWRIKHRLFDYQGHYRKANALR